MKLRGEIAGPPDTPFEGNALGFGTSSCAAVGQMSWSFPTHTDYVNSPIFVHYQEEPTMYKSTFLTRTRSTLPRYSLQFDAVIVWRQQSEHLRAKYYVAHVSDNQPGVMDTKCWS